MGIIILDQDLCFTLLLSLSDLVCVILNCSPDLASQNKIELNRLWTALLNFIQLFGDKLHDKVGYLACFVCLK